MHVPKWQTAVIQSNDFTPTGPLPIVVSTTKIPELPSEHHVLVRVLAVALNPTDYKNVTYFHTPGQSVGCDFCGVVAASAARTSTLAPGTRVCGGVFPYNTLGTNSGAFAEWVVADARLLVQIPEEWDELQGAALGGVGWGTVAIALSCNVLALQGTPSQPVEIATPVLVYGGGTATGAMACQLLRL